MNTGVTGENIYDFNSEENAAKWKGLLTAALKKVLEQVHPSLGAREEALEYVESLCLRLLGMLCAKPSPHTVQDVEDRVTSTFPTPIDKWALKEAQEALERGKKKSVLQLPVDKIHSLLQKELLLYKVDSTVSLFLVAVLEYISADILKLVGNYAKNIKHVEITYQDVQISMKVDKALMDMFYQDEGGGSSNLNETPVMLSTAPRTSLTYEETVRELIASEKAYLKELHMLIKVFREEIIKLNPGPQDIEKIFSNIMDIYELTYTLSGSLEDVREMAQEKMPYIGSCFEELAEAAEFDVYIKYARDVTSPSCRETLNTLLTRPEVQSSLNTAGQGMPLALRYYLPALLMGPIWHCFSYLDYITILKGLTPSTEDRETLAQVEGLLKPLQITLGSCVPTQTLPRSSAPLPQARARRQAALIKIHELEKIVENWDSKDLGQCCNEFVKEDTLIKVGNNKRLTDRRVFLFDGLMILCKPNSRRQSSVHHPSHPECKLKERFFIRKVEIIDHQDTEELKHAFEISPRQTPSVILCAKSMEDKNSWMADLVMLNNRSMLERVLDSILSDIERKHPLKLPPPELYKFAEPDSKDNIILEQRENGGVPLIKGATIYKLVERLTYHIYADPKFVRTFLTTYRSFCSPTELLDLLIERFQIPDPSLVYEQDCCDTDKMQKSSQREDWKKYRKEYCQPVQFRVLNVLRHWVDHHFYDFERDAALLVKLQNFLDSVHGKSMRKWVDSVIKIVQRKMENDNQRHIKFAFDDPPPPIERHINCPEDEYGILTLHPVELARQLTILEFDLYRTIKPSELVGSVWTKRDKETTSPNLLKMIKHTTDFTRWLEKNIVEAENFEERVAIVNRVIEIMICLNDINNFNGVLAIVSALGSASVYRLHCTFNALTVPNRKALEDSRKSDDRFKKYQEKLRSINPPCVPFLGMYLTNILHIEEGNPDFLPNTQLINFFKRRKVAEITGEIQQYQNQPYCFSVEPSIRHFLETLNPFGEMNDTEISNYLYQKSLEIEPRGSKIPPKFPRKWPHLNLKSPGIKTVKTAKSVPSAVANTISQTLNSTIKSDDSKSEDSSRSDNDFSVFAPVQLGTGQNSPTLSPVSPAASNPIMNWFHHTRSSSVSSIISTTSFRPSRTEPIPPSIPQRYSHNSQSSTGGPNSPGPHSPVSPGPHLPTEPISPRLPPTPPPPPPPLPPRRRRDSPEISSPQQMRQAPDAPILPPRDNSLPRDNSPPPLPPRREPGASPSAHSHSHSHSFPHHFMNPLPNIGGHSTLPRLNPTYTSQLHMRRHATLHPHPQQHPSTHNGTSLPPAAQPPSISPRYTVEVNSGQVTPQLPPRPTVRSAGLACGTMFQYPTTTTT
ncbi:protein son of sevenless [Diabrotica undecimpunctata]|uniref:protein son of sevenless n=1 Tax=Diabrotica undecimpunctata TaxID=50387 RepID=UPI003B63DC3C